MNVLVVITVLGIFGFLLFLYFGPSRHAQTAIETVTDGGRAIPTQPPQMVVVDTWRFGPDNV
jgi:hypothetical protein